jgi:hypothetical protein
MVSAEQSQGGELGVAEAAAKMDALLGAKDGQPEAPKRAIAPAEAPEAEASGYEGEETESDGADPAYDAAPEGEEPEYSEDTEGADTEPLPLDALVTVKINGKTENITLKEALEGYQRNSDYTRKTQALKQEVQTFAQERQQVEVEKQQYGQLINALHQQLQQFAPQEPNWEQLHRDDPLNFPIVEKQWRDYKERVAATGAERERMAHMASQQEQAQLQHMVERGREYLFNKVPEWKDAQKWNEARSRLRDYGQKVGYTDEELGAAYDPRAILVLDKARRYDAMMANRPKPDQSAGPKPMRSGTIANTPRAATEVSRAKDRLSRTGSVDDAAKLFGLLDRRK